MASRSIFNPVQTTQRQQGFTLVEVLLVLVVLTVLLGLAWPSLDRMFARNAMQSATETLRSDLIRCRLEAIDDELIYEFRYEPSGQKYLVIPHEQPLGTDPEAPVSGDDGLKRIAGEMDEAFRFEKQSDVAFTVDQQFPSPAEWQLAGLPLAMEWSSVGWSQPILFYPNGSAMSSQFEIHHEDGEIMRVSIRDLTGAVSIVSKRAEDAL
ncbi:prepilin-type N-terminal cleavage/methylation domain-containing protein [Thalassoroseus pseudoceratinae]|uniref:prepilin-type N-terminal cleavage/methylation domain-containing protein n=1 Tax=Thalassoroseus pseudoceratinae TaxID=2713176 RepID=UPI001423A402|nr:prepilin-type N-terminal cleavage/methylation domain-containing protein [Thalassoroseus pseudoceratinae]